MVPQWVEISTDEIIECADFDPGEYYLSKYPMGAFLLNQNR